MAIHISVASASVSRRGTKKTCENEECRIRFYDLNRALSACPACGAKGRGPAVVIDFETIGKKLARKFNRRAEPQKPPAEMARVGDEAVDEQAEKETELPSTAEALLIEIEDDDGSEASSDASGDMVVQKEPE